MRTSALSRLSICAAAIVAACSFATTAFAIGSSPFALERNQDFREARRLIDEKRYPEAIATLTRLRDDFPTTPDIANWIAYSYRKMKDYPTSKRYYDEALSIDPNFLPALEYQGEWFIETGDIASAKLNLAKLKSLCEQCEETKDLAEALTKAGH